jgi:hypothetical protein
MRRRKTFYLVVLWILILILRIRMFWASLIRILPFSYKGGERTEIMLAKFNFNTKFLAKN